jgi:hypothetical protein
MVEIMFVIRVWSVIYDDSPQGYSVQYPPLEMHVIGVTNVPALRREVLRTSARYAGKDTLTTSGFVMNYGQDEPKIKGLKQFWERPILTRSKPL